MDRRGFLGTNASLSADLSLLVGISVALLLTLGVVMAVRGRYTTHRWIQSAAVTLNVVQVLAIMVGSFARSARPGIPARLDEPFYLVATVHAAIGSFALLLGTFVALRGNELVPRVLKFSNYKLWMRSAYGLYMLATALGVWVYVTWYAAAQPKAATTQAATTQAATTQAATTQATAPRQRVPMANFVFNPAELIVPAGATVEWANEDGAPHTATSDDGTLFKSATLGSGESFDFRFDTPGEYAYYCELHGSAGGIGMAGTIRVVAPGEETQLAANPPPAAPAAGDEAPTPPPLPRELFEQPVGTAAFRDELAYGDAIEIELQVGDRAPAEPLAAFLLSADGAAVLPLGALPADGERAELQYVAPNGERLAGSYSRLLVTSDTASATRPSGNPVFEATLPPLAFGHLSRLLGEPAGGSGYALMLRQQADELARHIVLLAASQAASDTPGMRRHGEHVFNLVAGSRDSRFGDLDGDGRSQNPGDGFGLLLNGDQAGYIAATREAALAAADAEDATAAITTHGRHVVECADNLRAWAEEARELALRVAEAPDTSAAGQDVARLQTLGRWIQRGNDGDGDGLIAPLPGEGGGLVAYEHAMYMAGFGLVPATP